VLEVVAAEVVETNFPLLSSSQTFGPHSGQALGCAWKRLSSGESYSCWQAGHILKASILVSALS